jgi:hypothetical protein
MLGAFPVVENLANAPCNTSCLGIHMPSVILMTHELARAATFGNNDRLGTRPRLQHDDSKRLVSRWHHSRVTDLMKR